VDVTEIVKKPRDDRRGPSTGTIRIVLADDRNVVREAIKCLLEAERDFEVVGEVDDGLAVAPLVERLRPHIVILDVAIPGLFSLEVARQVRQRAPQTAVIVLSRYVNDWYVAEALRNGAAGYVAQRAEARELIHAVRAVARGGRYLSAPMSMDDVQTWLTGSRHTGDPYETLTGREREVLQLVAEGNSSTRVARRLTISVRTAEAHRANVMRKLRLKNHTALIRYALARGVLPPLEPLPPGFRVTRRRRSTAQ
jgi:two-component system, NarL family, response regulator NreC